MTTETKPLSPEGEAELRKAFAAHVRSGRWFDDSVVATNVQSLFATLDLARSERDAAREALKQATAPLGSQAENFARVVTERNTTREALRNLLAWTWDPDANATEQFEQVGDEYYRATGFLRPGKSEPMETGRNSDSDENRKRFDAWRADRQRALRIAAGAALREKP